MGMYIVYNFFSFVKRCGYEHDCTVTLQEIFSGEKLPGKVNGGGRERDCGRTDTRAHKTEPKEAWRRHCIELRFAEAEWGLTYMLNTFQLHKF